MKLLKLSLITFFTIFLLTGCASNTQADVIDSSKEDISNLLNDLIKKEQELIETKQKLEECQENKK